jgi:hypothetical protein
MASSGQDPSENRRRCINLRKNPKKKRMFGEVSDEDSLTDDIDHATIPTEPPKKRKASRPTNSASTRRGASRLMNATPRRTATSTPADAAQLGSMHGPRGVPQPADDDTLDSITVDISHLDSMHGSTRALEPTETLDSITVTVPRPTLAARRPTGRRQAKPSSTAIKPPKSTPRPKKASRPATGYDMLTSTFQDSLSGLRKSYEANSDNSFPPGYHTQVERHGSAAALEAIRASIAAGEPAENYTSEVLEQLGFPRADILAAEDEQAEAEEEEESDDGFFRDALEMISRPYDPSKEPKPNPEQDGW